MSLRKPEVEPWRRQWVEEMARETRPPAPAVPAAMRFAVALCLGYIMLSALASPLVQLLHH